MADWVCVPTYLWPYGHLGCVPLWMQPRWSVGRSVTRIIMADDEPSMDPGWPQQGSQARFLFINN